MRYNTTNMYVLVGHDPVPEPDMVKWGEFMARAERHVAETTIGPLWISTVFLGLDYNYFGGAPVLYETMIFGFDDNDSYQTRCCTWDEAVRMHAMARDIAETLVDVTNVSLAAFGDKMKVQLKITRTSDAHSDDTPPIC